MNQHAELKTVLPLIWDTAMVPSWHFNLRSKMWPWCTLIWKSPSRWTDASGFLRCRKLSHMKKHIFENFHQLTRIVSLAFPSQGTFQSVIHQVKRGKLMIETLLLSFCVCVPSEHWHSLHHLCRLCRLACVKKDISCFISRSSHQGLQFSHRLLFPAVWNTACISQLGGLILSVCYFTCPLRWNIDIHPHSCNNIL